MDTKQALKKAIDQADGQVLLAEKLQELTKKKCRQQNVSDWLQRGRTPTRWVIPIEKITGVSRHDLDPETYPREEAA